ncbi:TldD/PmbA family protein [Sulfobacillus thermosulfidooxidans]|uniref:TldD protein n=1 Tax=Sulfobacillus thermosulfidooxidans (strain DSM 9293 / VKM B-1269 / AT-1) TaxID=929705 RepID=A0A1W1WKW2_SULTA|nr:TldD/PmbA family protein [Sulfobacillus thermosulfidooxidans]OLZ09478.1 hypothetical protein BFX05_10915 [Sulfobacillus thermosulfidooxidans]OLZ16216.1 hypothetical protein BFX06_04125 [Sulfobacillus thermosulfidooxidans]OLZ17936.1 hypothetical protein BFX07_06005 [Sulfobacillus thermosulfidooxidans]SMC06954.1 TldD protein [Sulfobacillus thermosulfidooxidans DSM 9293]
MAELSTNYDGVLSTLQAILQKISAEYIEIRLEINESTQIETVDNQIKRQEHSMDIGGNVRVLSEGAFGFVHFDGWYNIEQHVQTALLLAKLSRHLGTSSTMSAAAPVQITQRLLIKEDPRAVPVDIKSQLLMHYADIAHQYSPSIRSVTGRYFDRYRHLWFINNLGTQVEQEKLDLGGAIVVMARDHHGVAQRAVSFGSSDDFGVVRLLTEEVEEAAKSAIALLSAPEIEGGEYTVVIDPHLAGVFAHEAFGHLSEADGQIGDAGILETMKLGRRFGPPNLHIYDTGRDVGSRGYLPIDDEGVEAHDVDLIKEGILVGRLHSKETAAALGDEPTGNARALHYRFPPIVRMRNTVIAPGDTPLPDMFQGIKRGIYAKGSHGGQTNGELFTFLAGEAYLIEDGHVTRPLRNAVLTGNVFTTLANISAIGTDFTRFESGGGCGKAGQMPLPVSHHAPSLRIEHCLVGGKKS